jgi:DNA-binding transcriptional ArsR family regulator
MIAEDQTGDDGADDAAAGVAAAIGEPARARMLYCLMDGQARTSTELSVVAEVAPSTASAHLARLTGAGLVTVRVEGKHRHYSLAGPAVARVLEGLSVLGGGAPRPERSRTPTRLRAARACYDHLAGRIGVGLHDRFRALGYLTLAPGAGGAAYDLSPEGTRAMAALGIDVAATRAQRRRFAYGCLDWSERRPHLAGALGAAVLASALSRGWVVRELDSRALDLTSRGRRALASRFGVAI